MKDSRLLLPGTNNSFSGVDIVASITIPDVGTYVFGEIQTISYSIHRDKHPVRACGFINPKGFTRGPRTIAGSIIFTVFDQHIIRRIINKARKKGVRGYEGNVVTDELPPFDVTISLSNEYGYGSRLAIYGITIVDEGQVMSVDDMLTEQTMSYVATGIELMRKNDASQSNSSEEDDEIASGSSGGVLTDLEPESSDGRSS